MKDVCLKTHGKFVFLIKCVGKQVCLKIEAYHQVHSVGDAQVGNIAIVTCLHSYNLYPEMTEWLRYAFLCLP